MKSIFYRNIEQNTQENDLYRKVIYTIPGKMQLVLMNLKPGEIIPKEMHRNTVQFFRIESGDGQLSVWNKNGTRITRTYLLQDGISVIVPNGRCHEVFNISTTKDLKMYTIYMPPEHRPGRRNTRQPRR